MTQLEYVCVCFVMWHLTDLTSIKDSFKKATYPEEEQVASLKMGIWAGIIFLLQIILCGGKYNSIFHDFKDNLSNIDYLLFVQLVKMKEQKFRVKLMGAGK